MMEEHPLSKFLAAYRAIFLQRNLAYDRTLGVQRDNQLKQADLQIDALINKTKQELSDNAFEIDIGPVTKIIFQMYYRFDGVAMTIRGPHAFMKGGVSFCPCDELSVADRNVTSLFEGYDELFHIGRFHFPLR